MNDQRIRDTFDLAYPKYGADIAIYEAGGHIDYLDVMMPLRFWNVWQKAYIAGQADQRENDAKLCDDRAIVMWSWWESRADPTDQGQAMASDDLSEAIRASKSINNY